MNNKLLSTPTILFFLLFFTTTQAFSQETIRFKTQRPSACLLYTSDAADERSSVDLGGRRIIKKKTRQESVGRNSMRK